MKIERFWHLWDRMVERARFPSGLLLTGPPALVERAEDLWAPMMCLAPSRDRGVWRACERCDACRKRQWERSPHHWLMTAGDHRTVPLERIRAMQRELSLAHAHKTGAGHFFVIMPRAHEISIAGWNVMLKVIEEPPPRVLFLVFGRQLKAVPPTIRSRLVAYYVHPEAHESDARSQAAPSADRNILNLAMLQSYIQQYKPHQIEDWTLWIKHMRRALHHALGAANPAYAAALSGAYLEMSEMLSRKRIDGSVNLKYEISRIIAQYEKILTRTA